MTLLYILRNHNKLRAEAEAQIEEARALLRQERERVFARFGGAARFSDELLSGTPDHDAKIAAAMDDILIAEQEYARRIAPLRAIQRTLDEVERAVTEMPEPYRTTFLALYYGGQDETLTEWETRRRIDDGIAILTKSLNPLARREKPW